MNHNLYRAGADQPADAAADYSDWVLAPVEAVLSVLAKPTGPVVKVSTCACGGHLARIVRVRPHRVYECCLCGELKRAE